MDVDAVDAAGVAATVELHRELAPCQLHSRARHCEQMGCAARVAVCAGLSIALAETDGLALGRLGCAALGLVDQDAVLN